MSSSAGLASAPSAFTSLRRVPRRLALVQCTISWPPAPVHRCRARSMLLNSARCCLQPGGGLGPLSRTGRLLWRSGRARGPQCCIDCCRIREGLTQIRSEDDQVGRRGKSGRVLSANASGKIVVRLHFILDNLLHRSAFPDASLGEHLSTVVYRRDQYLPLLPMCHHPLFRSAGSAARGRLPQDRQW